LGKLLAFIGAVFIIAKLFGWIAWSWWLVLIPFYPIAFIYGVAIVIVAFFKAIDKDDIN
jgi:hypothetical protein